MELLNYMVQFSSAAQSCPTHCNPMRCSTPGLPVHYQLLELAQAHVHWVGDAIQPLHPQSPLLLPSILPSIRVFSNEWVLHIRWPKYWSFSFNISPSKEYSGLISFRLTGLIFCPMDSQESSPAPQFESIDSLVLSLFYGLTLTPTMWAIALLFASWRAWSKLLSYLALPFPHV